MEIKCPWCEISFDIPRPDPITREEAEKLVDTFRELCWNYNENPGTKNGNPMRKLRDKLIAALTG